MGKMSQSDASRIQSTQAKSGGDMTSGGFAARAQGAGDRNANAGASAQGSTQGSSGGQTGSSGGVRLGYAASGNSAAGSEASQKKYLDLIWMKAIILNRNLAHKPQYFA